MLTYLMIGFGGALGSMGRFWIGGLAARGFGEGFPIGTLVVNVTGSLAIGLFAALTAEGGRFAVGPELRALLMVGVCGGYTTFSAFSLQTLDLIRNGAIGMAGLNATLSFALCLGATWLGLVAAGPLGGK